MMSKSTRDDLATHWVILAFDRVPVSPWLVGLGLAGVLSLASLGADALSGPTTRPLLPVEPAIAYFFAIFIGYILASMVYGVHRSQADLELFHTSPPDAGREQTDLSLHPRRLLRSADAAGVALGIVIPEFVVGRLAWLARGEWNLYEIWMFVLGLAFWWSISVGAAITVANVLTVQREGAAQTDVPLFDPQLGLPLARFALRMLVLILGFPLVAMGIGFARGMLMPVIVIPVLVAGLALGIFGMAAPLSGLRRRIRERKQAELQGLDRAILGERGALAQTTLADEADRLSQVDLLRYRREVASVREWRFDGAVGLRFALYLALPILSWVAAALVERTVDFLFQR